MCGYVVCRERRGKGRGLERVGGKEEGVEVECSVGL